MALKHIVGMDHVVVVARDLDAAAQRWADLGFTLSPRGTHSAHLGTGNHTIMLGPDYIELLGVLAETPHNAPTRAFLDRRGEGLERVAFTTDDAAAGVDEIRALGLVGAGPLDFGRPVTLPDGGETRAAFRTFFWPTAEAPGGLRLFACQHLTPEAVWIPALQSHANTAARIARVEILSAEPQAEAAHLARLIDGEAQAEGEAVQVPSGSGRGDFVFLRRQALGQRYPDAAIQDIQDGGAALVLIVRDLDAAARAVGPRGLRTRNAVCVPPAAANGVLLAFEAESGRT